MQKCGFSKTKEAFVLETSQAQSLKGTFEHGVPTKSCQEDDHGEKANGKSLNQLLSHFDNAFEDAFFEVSMAIEKTSKTMVLQTTSRGRWNFNIKLKLQFSGMVKQFKMNIEQLKKNKLTIYLTFFGSYLQNIYLSQNIKCV